MRYLNVTAKQQAFILGKTFLTEPFHECLCFLSTEGMLELCTFFFLLFSLFSSSLKTYESWGGLRWSSCPVVAARKLISAVLRTEQQKIRTWMRRAGSFGHGVSGKQEKEAEEDEVEKREGKTKKRGKKSCLRLEKDALTIVRS